MFSEDMDFEFFMDTFFDAEDCEQNEAIVEEFVSSL